MWCSTRYRKQRLFSGLILRIPIWDQPDADEVFDDSDFWEMPTDGVPPVEDNPPASNIIVEMKM